MLFYFSKIFFVAVVDIDAQVTRDNTTKILLFHVNFFQNTIITFKSIFINALCFLHL